MSHTISALMLVIIAGIFNGSFAMPTKYIKVDDSKLWFYFSFWAFLIVPFCSFFLIDNHFMSFLFKVQTNAIVTPFIAGLIWGLGMIGMSLALKHIGIGIVFTINIGIGIAGGTLIPLLFFPYGTISEHFINLVAIALFFLLSAVLLAGIAAHKRDSSKTLKHDAINKATLTAILLSILAGLGSAVQGAAYAYSTQFYRPLAFSYPNHTFVITVLPWLLIFLGAWIPYMLYFFLAKRKILNKSLNQNKTTIAISTSISIKDYALIIIMALLFFECIVFYSKASQLLGTLGPIIAWPLFLSFIILTSNFWSYAHGEWKNTAKSIIITMLTSIASLIISIIILTYASTYIK